MNSRVLYQPNSEEIIYHYCSAATCLAICTNKSLQFSDLMIMNDSSELIYSLEIFESLKNAGLSTSMYGVIQDFTHESLFLTSCFSQAPDLLSQWRAYADDGNGFCIGFCANTLLHLPVYPVKIIYNANEQKNNLINHANCIEKNLSNYDNESFMKEMLQLTYDFAGYKAYHFFEEPEIRLVHLGNKIKENNRYYFTDLGGI